MRLRKSAVVAGALGCVALLVGMVLTVFFFVRGGSTRIAMFGDGPKGGSRRSTDAQRTLDGRSTDAQRTVNGRSGADLGCMVACSKGR